MRGADDKLYTFYLTNLKGKDMRLEDIIKMYLTKKCGV